MTRVFLDANVLFSAAWREDSGVGVLWSRQDVHLVTSWYAMTEAQRNIELKKPAASTRLSELASRVEVSTHALNVRSDHGLPDKDLRILEAAIGSKCSILLTGDIAHFGHLIGHEIDGVKILTISMFVPSDRSA